MIECDLDRLFDVGLIKTIIFDSEDHQFYMLCNKFMDELGIYLVRFCPHNPKNFKFHIKIKNEKFIEDCEMFVNRL